MQCVHVVQAAKATVAAGGAAEGSGDEDEGEDEEEGSLERELELNYESDDVRSASRSCCSCLRPV